MRFELIASTLFASALAQNCLWNVNGVTQTIPAGGSIRLNGIGVACGTTSSPVFGVFAKCKIAYDQKTGTCDTYQLTTVKDTINCVYKPSGTPNYGTCKEVST